MARPKEAQVNEREIKRLVSVFRTASREIFNDIINSPLRNQVDRTVLLRQINTILRDLTGEVDKETESFIKQAYRTGYDDAGTQLEALGRLQRSPFSLIHREAVAALISETQEGFGDAIAGVSRHGRMLMSEVVKEQIKARLAIGRITGEVRKEVANKIKNILRENGIVSFVDSAGRSWTLERYADTLYRTKAAEARNTALANRMLQNGFDLVQVTDTQSTHETCIRWENKILSLTGRTPGYPTLAEAKADGLFHPNCKHAINAFNRDLAERTQAYNARVREYL